MENSGEQELYAKLEPVTKQLNIYGIQTINAFVILNSKEDNNGLFLVRRMLSHTSENGNSDRHLYAMML